MLHTTHRTYYKMGRTTTNPIRREKKTILVKKPTEERKFCLHCGKDITHLHGKSKYCCPLCGDIYRKAHPEMFSIPETEYYG